MVSEEEVSIYLDALHAEDDAKLRVLAADHLAVALEAFSFRLPMDTFGRFVGCRRDPERALAAVFAELHLTDLYLACGCLESVAGAAEVFLARFTPDIARVASKFARSRSVTADDLVQTVAERMLVAAKGRTPGLGLYRGTGPLAGFVQVTAARLALNATEKKTESLEPEAGLFAALLVSSRTPEMSLHGEHARSFLRAAFHRAVARLEERERAVLAYSLCDGLSIDVIGRIYGVHRATVARWSESARDTLVQTTRDELARELGLSDTQIDALARDGLSRFELSVTRSLRAAFAE